MAKIGGYGEMLDDEKRGVFDFTVNGECSNCGECCSNFLPVSSSEVKEIKRYIEKHGIKEQNTHYPTADRTFNLTCPFRSEIQRECLVYPVRPAICRVFKCDHPRERIRKNKELFHKKFDIVDMRSEFYGRENAVGKLLEALSGK